MKDSKLIVLEGIDGSGKTVQTKLLLDKLRSLNYTAMFLDFPNYRGFFGKEIGNMLQGDSVRADEVDPKSMALWYALDRFSRMAVVHNNVYADFIVCNRFTLSNIAYQSVRYTGEDNLEKWIRELEQRYLKIPEPTIHIVFDVNPQISSDQIKGRESLGRTEEADVYESSLVFIKKVREKYLELAKHLMNIVILDVMDGDTIKSKEAIHEEVMTILHTNKILE